MGSIECSLGLYEMASGNEPGQRLKWVVTVSAKKKKTALQRESVMSEITRFAMLRLSGQVVCNFPRAWKKMMNVKFLLSTQLPASFHEMEDESISAQVRSTHFSEISAQQFVARFNRV